MFILLIVPICAQGAGRALGMSEQGPRPRGRSAACLGCRRRRGLGCRPHQRGMGGDQELIVCQHLWHLPHAQLLCWQVHEAARHLQPRLCERLWAALPARQRGRRLGMSGLLTGRLAGLLFTCAISQPAAGMQASLLGMLCVS